MNYNKLQDSKNLKQISLWLLETCPLQKTSDFLKSIKSVHIYYFAILQLACA